MILYRPYSPKLDDAMLDNSMHNLKSFLGFISLYFYLLLTKGIFFWKISLYDDIDGAKIGWKKTYVITSKKCANVAFITFFTSNKKSLTAYNNFVHLKHSLYTAARNCVFIPQTWDDVLAEVSVEIDNIVNGAMSNDKS